MLVRLTHAMPQLLSCRARTGAVVLLGQLPGSICPRLRTRPCLCGGPADTYNAVQASAGDPGIAMRIVSAARRAMHCVYRRRRLGMHMLNNRAQRQHVIVVYRLTIWTPCSSSQTCMTRKAGCLPAAHAAVLAYGLLHTAASGTVACGSASRQVCYIQIILTKPTQRRAWEETWQLLTSAQQAMKWHAMAAHVDCVTDVAAKQKSVGCTAVNVLRNSLQSGQHLVGCSSAGLSKPACDSSKAAQLVVKCICPHSNTQLYCQHANTMAPTLGRTRRAL
jgi:hypothetical protein